MSTKAIPVTGFFDELKRRKVYRVAVAYVIAAGGVIQLVSAVFPAWELPNWTLRLTVVLLLVGFPIALVLAWAYDVTPEGIRLTPNLAFGGSTLGRHAHRRRNIFLLGLSGLTLAAVAGFFLLPRLTATSVEKSIAVLPFENLSADKENAYFADGIQDDILTNLAKISDLKVISRTSVMGYRGQTHSARDIGKDLGVGAVLEGSVRREGNRVRLNVQLIDTKTDRHLWAEDYDRELTDVFAIQTDLAQKIAEELQAQLSPTEREQMMRKPTENGEAYVAFVQASSWHSSLEDFAKLKEAEQLYQRAIQLDPKFALALANLSILESWIFHTYEPIGTRAELARSYAQRAVDLQPDLAEAHLARGFSLYYGDRDYDAALKELAIAQRALPNDSRINLVIGAIQRRQGRWDESTAHLKKAARLSPNETWVLQNLALNHRILRDYEATNRVIDRALALEPRSLNLWFIKAGLAIEERGDYSVEENALALLERPPAGVAGAKSEQELSAEDQAIISFARSEVALVQGKYEEAQSALQRVNDEALAAKPEWRFKKRMQAGIVQQKLGQSAEARASFQEAKELAQADVAAAPNDAPRRANLARALAHLGEKEEAIAQAKRATQLLPESVDAFEGPDMTAALAEVYALAGENAKAIALFDGLLSRPSNVTVAALRIDPAMEQLRADPDFQAMLQKHEPRA
jgi:TolB-like protein/Flp pilus assembly protein TadD